jgi:hypothetical protein
MPLIPGTISIAPFPVGFQGDLNGTFQQAVSQMQIQTTSNLLTGTIEGTQPTSDSGPWIHNRQIYFWDKAASLYLPQFTRSGGTFPTDDEGPILLNGQWYFWDAATSKYTAYIPASMRSRNTLVNGYPQVWQRPNPVASLPGQILYAADRWQISQGVAVTGRLSVSHVNSASVPGGTFNVRGRHTMSIQCTTAQSTLGSNDNCGLFQGVELHRAFGVTDQPSSLSLWLWATQTGVYCAAITNADNTESLVVECNVTTASTWQRFAFPNLPTMPTGLGNWGSTGSDLCYRVGITLAAGGTYRIDPAQAGTWQPALRIATNNQVNFFSSTSNQLQVSFVQHEPGSTCTPFEFQNFADELQACRRYYQTTYPYGVQPGTPSLGGVVGVFESAQTIRFPGVLPVTLRARPTPNVSVRPFVNFYSPISGGINAVRLVRTNNDFGMGNYSLTEDLGLKWASFAIPVANIGDVGITEAVYDVDF